MPLLEKPKGKRSLKCSQCNTFELWCDREAMMKIQIEEKKHIYIHHDCHEAYVTAQENKLEEMKNSKLLYEFIKKIHGIQSVPQSFLISLVVLRKGIRGKKHPYSKIEKVDDFNIGFTFKEILEAYHMSEKQWMKVKPTIYFDHLISELNYCLKIVQQNLIYVIKKMNEQEELEAYGEMFGWKLKKTTNN